MVMMPRWYSSMAQAIAEPAEAVSSPRSLQMLLRRSTWVTSLIPMFGPNLPSVTYSGPSPLMYLWGGRGVGCGLWGVGAENTLAAVLFSDSPPPTPHSPTPDISFSGR